jgi:hypothetical protein
MSYAAIVNRGAASENICSPDHTEYFKLNRGPQEYANVDIRADDAIPLLLG